MRMAKKTKNGVTAEVTKVVKDTVVKTGERFLDLEITVDDGNGQEVVRRGYPLNTSKEDIEADIEKMLETRQKEREQAETQAALDEAEAQATETAEAVDGMKVTA